MLTVVKVLMLISHSTPTCPSSQLSAPAVPPEDIRRHQDLSVIKSLVVFIAVDIHFPITHIDSHDVIDQALNVSRKQSNDHVLSATLFDDSAGIENDSQDVYGLSHWSVGC